MNATRIAPSCAIFAMACASPALTLDYPGPGALGTSVLRDSRPSAKNVAPDVLLTLKADPIPSSTMPPASARESIPQPVPEPASLAALGVGFAGLLRRRRLA